MGILRSKGYQDIDAENKSNISNNPVLVDPECQIPQEIEMASVSVVPDGNILYEKCTTPSCI